MKGKYFSKKVRNAFGTFDSKAEYNRFLVLKDMAMKGMIGELHTHVRFLIIPALVKEETLQLKTKLKKVTKTVEQAAYYTSDFTYIENGKFVIEEVKSAATRLARDYPLRRKLIRKWIDEHNKSHGHEMYKFREVVI